VSVALVIGTGRMARLRLSVLLSRDDIERCIVLSSNPARAAPGLAASNVEVVERAALDSIASPAMTFVSSATERHLEDLSAAIPLGCPILCEKPLAAESDAARALVDRAAAVDALLHVAFQRRFEPALRDLRRRIAENQLGVLYHLRFTHFDRRPSGREFIAASGGIFRDLLVHDIECALWLTQRSARWVFATGAVRRWSDYSDFGDCDTATVLMALDDELTVTLNGARHDPLGQDARVEVLGSSGAVAVGLTQATPLDAIDAPGLFGIDAPQSFQERFAAAYVAETNAFVDFVLGRSDRFGGTTGEEAVAAIAVAEQCLRSQESGGRIALGP
jgi:myo-inositol 2-dehydrogenase/D-chiro-inositol 1-dehydrogenase